VVLLLVTFFNNCRTWISLRWTPRGKDSYSLLACYGLHWFCCRWKAKRLTYKHVTAAYGAAKAECLNKLP
jgi:hypothetical protein